MVLLFLFIAVLLLLLNAFFVLAEFAAVKVRATRVEELVEKGDRRAKILATILPRLDDYLSLCQVGITFASIGLGFVGEPAFARLIEPAVRWTGVASEAVAHTIAILVAYFLVSYLHVVIGEQVPKMAAIRRPDVSALWVAAPLKVCRMFFYGPLVLLSFSTKFVLRLLGLAEAKEPQHTEEELRILMARSEETGMISFQRLLLFENVFDLGDLRVKDAMRSRDSVKVLRADAPWEENLKTIRECRFSRYPLLTGGETPVGFVHVKDLLFLGPEMMAKANLRKLMRPYWSALEDAPLEQLLTELQRHRPNMALVFDKAGKWTGFLTLEDVIEEITGAIEDEFEVDPQVFLADVLLPERMFLGLEARSIPDAVQKILTHFERALPLPREKVQTAVLAREQAMSTYIGRGVALPHARLDGIDRPYVFLARCSAGIPVPRRDERTYLVFLILTPSSAPRVQARLLSRITGLLQSEYVEERLREAQSPEELYEAIKAGDPVALA
ncbi:MAG: DUF21 domain-containing protein [Planctomycetes bacterium]|nr:DUF21 domain-containing protein [Planctomycetota bacterium]